MKHLLQNMNSHALEVKDIPPPLPLARCERHCECVFHAGAEKSTDTSLFLLKLISENNL